MLVRERFAQQPLARGIFLHGSVQGWQGAACLQRGPRPGHKSHRGEQGWKGHPGEECLSPAQPRMWPGTSPLVTWATAWWPTASPTSNECARCLVVAPVAVPVTRGLRSCHKTDRSEKLLSYLPRCPHTPHTLGAQLLARFPAAGLARVHRNTRCITAPAGNAQVRLQQTSE